MRELTQDEIKLFSFGSSEDDERRMPPVTTTVRRRPRSDPSPWEIAGGANLGGGTPGEDSQESQECQQHAANIEAAQAELDLANSHLQAFNNGEYDLPDYATAPERGGQIGHAIDQAINAGYFIGQVNGAEAALESAQNAHDEAGC